MSHKPSTPNASQSVSGETSLKASATRRADRYVAPIRWLGYVEGVSMLTLLLVAMPLKYALGRPEAVSVVGMIHGLLFLFYAGALAALFAAGSLRLRAMLLGWVAAVIPLGPWLLDHRVYGSASTPRETPSSEAAGSVPP